ncbi:Mycocerosic acid synthase-like polyketide synthase [Candidatus Entotheonellaceae bacterium PAL068K]
MDSKSFDEPIAIIGMGCRFPGAESPEEFWQLLCHGVDAITEVPADRLDVDALYDPRPGTSGKIVARQGGFLQRLDQFDPAFFGISPREAAYMDPQQRLLLEVAWEAFEDAGVVPDRLAGRQTGVFIGMWTNDYEDRMYQASSDIDLYVTTGGGRYSASGRLSYVFDLQGPSVTVDTACSSSLVTVHLACQSLRRGESDLALAGGVNLILQPYITIGYSKSHMLSPDARCKFGDARANGYVRSEGVGVILLKPLSRALADSDPISALIVGSAVNNDGRSSGLLVAPSRQGQEAMLRQAYRSAGISPGKVCYIEAHGTGTSVGDPVELRALGTVLATDRSQERPCLIGSVKTNIGHTEAASGIAGLIKAALCLKHRMIPPSLHFQDPNPNIPWHDLPLLMSQELRPWPVEAAPAVAGVNSFGVTGTNAHVVLQEAPRTSGATPEAEPSGTTAHLLPLSAHSPEALDALVRAYQTHMAAEVQGALSLRHLGYTASLRRTHHEHRLSLVVHSPDELADHLDAFVQGEVRPGMSTGRTQLGDSRKMVFVFSGQGSQWLGMGRQLFDQEPVFRESMERCEQALQPHVDWSVLTQLTADAAASQLHRIDVIQPTLFALQVSLAALWRAWGITPDAVVGHSMGEVAATHVAGALSLADAARIICRRSRLLGGASGQGAMAVVELSFEQAQEALKGYEDSVSIAVSNSARSTVLSGDPRALEALLQQFESQEVFCRWVKVDVASHSPQMDPLRAELLQALEGLKPTQAAVPMYSTVTGQSIDGRQLDAPYWVRNLRQPVLFATVIQRLLGDGHEMFMEISAHPILMPAVQQGLQEGGHAGTVLPSLRRDADERASLLASLGTLYTQGYAIDWSRLYASGGQCVRLPAYPWQRQRFWLDDTHTPRGHGLWQRHSSTGHPLLGQHLTSSVHAGTHFWETDLSLEAFPYLDDHRVQGSVLLPAAAYVEMVMAAAVQAFGPGSHTLESVAFQHALVLPQDEMQTIQVVVAAEMPGSAAFKVLSRQASDTAPQAAWIVHATGTVRLGQADQTASPPPHDSLEKIRARCSETLTGAEHYRAMAMRGLEYGAHFQGVEDLWRQDTEALGRLHLPATTGAEADGYQVHPTLLDACFQVMVAALPHRDPHMGAAQTYLPVGLESIRVYHRASLADRLWAHALCQPPVEDLARTYAGDVCLLDAAGHMVLEMRGLCLQRLEPDTQQNLLDWLYTIQWQSTARPKPDETPGPMVSSQPGSWLIFTDGHGVGRSLAAWLEARGDTCVMIVPGDTYACLKPGYYALPWADPAAFEQLLTDALGADRPACRGVVHLWSLDMAMVSDTSPVSLDAAQGLGCGSVLHMVQALAQANWQDAPRLWLVTRGAQAIEESTPTLAVAQAPLWGLGAVIANEHPELRCTRVDLSPGLVPPDIQCLCEEIWLSPDAEQIALRGEARYIARLVQGVPEARLPAAPEASAAAHRSVATSDQNYRLEIPTPGIVDNLLLRATSRRVPDPGEVEIQVCAAGLNFLDVMKTMGVCPGLEPGAPVVLGAECSGRISAVGPGVDHLQMGEEVVAITPAFNTTSLFGAFVTLPAHAVVAKPPSLSFEEAATIPVVFFTAHYALHHLGRLAPGERVLIHAATGGVGLAAVQLAQQAGAEIFATAGSEEKRQYLRDLGIQHVMDSRTLTFAEDVMQRTGGEGVDLVLNSLAGEAIPKSLDILKPYGRFLEIGKRDIYQNSAIGLAPFKKNLAFFAIDLARMVEERPVFVATLFRDLMQRFADGTLKPLPLRVFPIGEAADAFRSMAQARHVGKIGVVLQDQEVRLLPAPPEAPGFRADGTYLITGGLGGLGLMVAQRMVEQGAKHLVLLSRSGISAATQPTLNAWTQAGVQVVAAQADVAQEEQMARVLAEMAQTMPPLRGVIHAAGILDDGILLHLSQERLQSVLAPKLHGAWNLHTLTVNAPLDFFVLFSSVAALLGPSGQGNYAAANAFLDALAHYRHALGRPGLSINWGPWSEVGLAAAARSNHSPRHAYRGLASITPTRGLQVLDQLLCQDATQVAVIPFQMQPWCRLYPTAAASSLLTDLVQARGDDSTHPSREPGEAHRIRQALLALAPGHQRRSWLEAHLQEQVARVLKLNAARIETHQPLRTLGMDSLMSLELRNRLEASLSLTLPATVMWNYPTLATLAPHLAGLLGIPLESAVESLSEPRASHEAPPSPAAQAEPKPYSPDEMQALLAQELATVEALLKGKQTNA